MSNYLCLQKDNRNINFIRKIKPISKNIENGGGVFMEEILKISDAEWEIIKFKKGF